MLPILLALALIFALLFLARIGAARRAALKLRWPALLLGLAALGLLLRGAIWPALGLTAAAAIAWVLAPSFARRAPADPPRPDPNDAEARTLLSVGPEATQAEIRAAYRAKMARAHPDRGGSHAAAARLTAARDRLLKKL